MSWQESLVRIADHEVDELRKRLVGILEAKAQAELKLVMLHAELESENARAAQDAEYGLYRLGYIEGWRARRDAAQAAIGVIEAEEAGCRDALSGAFENLKKYEHVAEQAQVAVIRERARRDGQAMDEMGQRMATRK